MAGAVTRQVVGTRVLTLRGAAFERGRAMRPAGLPSERSAGGCLPVRRQLLCRGVRGPTRGRPPRFWRSLRLHRACRHCSLSRGASREEDGRDPPRAVLAKVGCWRQRQRWRRLGVDAAGAHAPLQPPRGSHLSARFARRWRAPHRTARLRLVSAQLGRGRRGAAGGADSGGHVGIRRGFAGGGFGNGARLLGGLHARQAPLPSPVLLEARRRLGPTEARPSPLPRRRRLPRGFANGGGVPAHGRAAARRGRRGLD